MIFARRRRRRSQSGPLLGVAIAIMALFALLAFIESPLGILLALVLTAGAVVYGRVASRQQTLHARQWRTVENLRLLSGIQFERHVAELYRKLGYRTEITRGSGDQGIDVIAQNVQQRIGIQCKQWQGNVGNDAVQEALAGKIFYNCSHAAVICTSNFTPLAQQLAERSGVQLIDGNAYANMVNQFAVEPVKTFARERIPRGKPLFMQVGMLAAALLVFVVHFASPINLAAAGDAVTAAASRSAASTGQSSSSLALTVERFYDDINAKRYDHAYSLLSTSFQAEQSYSKFVQGYSTTISIKASIMPTGNGSVSVHLEARDSSPRGIIVSQYVGTWQGVVDPQGTWRLDSSGMRRT